MGSSDNEPRRNANEARHEVTVSSFYIGKHEVTQKEYEEVMGKGKNPSNFKGQDLPVEMVSWYDAIDYCNKRSQMEGLTPAYTVNGVNVSWNRNANGYRLPTEAEWEYACRAGTTGAYNNGWDGSTVANAPGWYWNNSNSKTHEVGKKPANAWGLYDMHGNVWEWCWDLYGDYSDTEQTNPQGALKGNERVIRGGSWYRGASYSRSACRNSDNPQHKSNGKGFRIARNL